MLKSKVGKGFVLAGCVAAVVGVAVSANAFSHSWRGGMMMRHMDANGDGQITRDEVMPRLIRRFDQADANSDGRVTKDEVKARIHKRLERKIEHIFARFDANEDGEMTKPELEAQIDVHFKRIDQNQDGVVSQDELKEFRRGFRKHMRKFFLKDQ